MTALDERPAVADLEALDFDPVIPCEHPDHAEHHQPVEQPARWLMRGPCPACREDEPGAGLPICHAGRARFLAAPYIACSACGQSRPRRWWKLTFEPIGRAS